MEFEALYARIQHHLASGRETEAINLLKDNLDRYRQLPEFWMLYAACHLNLKEWEQAEATAQAALALNPEHPSAGEMLAIALMRQHQRDQALEVIRHVIAIAPERASAHYWLGIILSSGIQNNEERILARQATEHALRLDPEDPDFYQGAAVAADMMDDNRSALGFLSAGLSIDPHHQGLLRSAASIENGHRIVGERGAMLRNMLASDPMNEGLHEDYAESFASRQGIYANRFWLFVPLLAVIAAFAEASQGSWVFAGVAAIVLAGGLFALWNLHDYRKGIKALPSGYLQEIHTRFPGLPKAQRAYQATWITAMLGAILGCFVSVPGAVILILASAAGQAGSLWVARDLAGVQQAKEGGEDLRRYLLKLSGRQAAGFWVRFGLVLAQLVLFGLGVGSGSRLAAVPLATAGLGILFVAVVLMICQFRLGFKGNAFAYGLAVSSSARNRGWALLRGNVGGAWFIAIHALFGVLFLVGSAGILITGVETDSSTRQSPVNPRSPVEENSFDEEKLKQLLEIQEQTEEQLEELRDLPSLQVPNQ